MKVHKNTLKKIKQLIEDAMDSEKTPSLEDSFTCLEQAIDKLNYLLTGNEME